MALQHSITLENGIELPAAYARISKVEHNHTHTYVEVDWWATAAARNDSKQTVRSMSYYIQWAETVSLQSCYNALKLLPEFDGAVDV